MTIDYASARAAMVEQQVRPWDVLDRRVLDVLAAMPRELFVPAPWQPVAYADFAIPLAHGEHMLKPVVAGRALQALLVDAGEDVLEIGTGSGYVTACLGSLGRDVISLERHADLAAAAQARVREAGLANIDVIHADALAWDNTRRFDAICVNAAVDLVPSRFVEWLRPGGRMFIVRGRAPVMEAVLVRRTGQDVNAVQIESLFETELDYLGGTEPVAQFQF